MYDDDVQWDELKVLRAAYGTDAAAKAALTQCRKMARETGGENANADVIEQNIRSNVSAVAEHAVRHWKAAQAATPAIASKMAKQAIVSSVRAPESTELNPQVSGKVQGKTAWTRAFPEMTLADPVADEKGESNLERIGSRPEARSDKDMGNPAAGDYDVIPSQPLPVAEYLAIELKRQGVKLDGTEDTDELLEAFGYVIARYQSADATRGELEQMAATRASYLAREARRRIDALQLTDLDGYWSWRLVYEFGMSQREAAERLGVAQSTVNLHAARFQRLLDGSNS